MTDFLDLVYAGAPQEAFDEVAVLAAQETRSSSLRHDRVLSD